MPQSENRENRPLRDRSRLKILPAVAADLPSVIDLLRRSGLPVDDLRATSLEHFTKAMENGRLLAVAGLEPVGQGDALLRSLVVRDDCRSRGVGRLLVKDMEGRARTLGIRRLFLLTDTAEHFFTAAGYQRIERTAVPTGVTHTAQFASLCPASAACMRKELETSEGPSQP